MRSPTIVLAALLLFNFFTPDPAPQRHACRWRLAALTLVAPCSGSARSRGQIRPPATDPRTLFLVRPEIEVFLCRDYVQEPLQPHWIFRVWRFGTTELLADLPVPLVIQIVTHYLAQAGLTATVLALQTPLEPERKALATAPSRAALRAAVGVPLRPIQEARRAARAARAGRAGRPSKGKE